MKAEDFLNMLNKNLEYSNNNAIQWLKNIADDKQNIYHPQFIIINTDDKNYPLPIVLTHNSNSFNQFASEVMQDKQMFQCTTAYSSSLKNKFYLKLTFDNFTIKITPARIANSNDYNLIVKAELDYDLNVALAVLRANNLLDSSLKKSSSLSNSLKLVHNYQRFYCNVYNLPEPNFKFKNNNEEQRAASDVDALNELPDDPSDTENIIPDEDPAEDEGSTVNLDEVPTEITDNNQTENNNDNPSETVGSFVKTSDLNKENNTNKANQNAHHDKLVGKINNPVDLNDDDLNKQAQALNDINDDSSGNQSADEKDNTINNKDNTSNSKQPDDDAEDINNHLNTALHEEVKPKPEPKFYHHSSVVIHSRNVSPSQIVEHHNYSDASMNRAEVDLDERLQAELAAIMDKNDLSQNYSLKQAIASDDILGAEAIDKMQSVL